eukprot:SAG11_NODE_40008_length_214_cov_39.739130_1_plen_71_part_11
MLQIQGNPEQRHDLSLTHGEASSTVAVSDDIADTDVDADNKIAAEVNKVKLDVKHSSGFYHNVGGVAGGQL